MGFIYKITNTINNYNYIGQTTKGIEQRFKEHLKRSNNDKSNNKFHNAIKHYGKENFRVDLVECCEDSDLNEREIYWISYYKKLNEAQYNIAEGGYNSPFKYKTSEEIRDIVNKAKKTMSEKSEEELKEIHKKFGHAGESNPNFGGSEKHKLGCKMFYKNNPGTHKGKNNPFYGKHHSEETKEKLSDIHKGNCYSEKFKNQSGENNFNYGKHGKDASNHREVRITFSDGSYMDFETRKQLGEYFGYRNGNKPPMNKILVSKKFPKINGAIVNYI